MKHTPGEWETRWNDSAICVGGQTLARVYWSEGRSEEENRGNARIMAAAPKMALLLKRIIVRDGLNDNQWFWLDDCKKLLAEIEGDTK